MVVFGIVLLKFIIKMVGKVFGLGFNLVWFEQQWQMHLVLLFINNVRNNSMRLVYFDLF